MSKLEALQESIFEAVEEDTPAVLSILLGNFVSLTEELMRRQLPDVDPKTQDLIIPGNSAEGMRKITIHKVGE